MTSVVGLVLVSTATSGIDNLPTLLGAAAAFGAGQQAVTRLLDDRAQDLISKNPSSPSPAA